MLAIECCPIQGNIPDYLCTSNSKNTPDRTPGIKYFFTRPLLRKNAFLPECTFFLFKEKLCDRLIKFFLLREYSRRRKNI